MTVYRQVDPLARRRAVIGEARRLRNSLAAAPRIYNIAGAIGSSQQIVDALSACIAELEMRP